MPGILKFFFVVDIIIMWYVISPMSVCFWRGTFDLLENHIVVDCRESKSGQVSSNGQGNASFIGSVLAEPCKEITGNWITLGMGMFTCWLMTCMAPTLSKHVRRNYKQKMHIIPYFLITRFYTYIYGFGFVTMWKGGWFLIDQYATSSWNENVHFLLVCVPILLLLRIISLAGQRPFGLEKDIDGVIFFTRPWFDTEWDSDPWQYCVEALLTQLSRMFVIMSWRAWWNIMDVIFIIPDQPTLGYAISGGVASVLLIFFYLLTFPLKKFSAKLDDKPIMTKIVMENAFYLVVNACLVCYWRCGMNLLQMYTFEDKIVRGWACHGIGFAGLLLLQATRSIFDSGLNGRLTGKQTRGNAFNVEVSYLQYFYINYKIKK